MIKLKLSNTDKVALLDDKDRDKLSDYTWWLANGYACSGYYVGTRKTGRKWISVRLHNFILKRKNGLFIDHINGNKLDNRRKNLRLASNQDNCRNMRQNARKTQSTSSRFKGVCYNPARGRWDASITVNYRPIFLGRYENEVFAAQAYNAGAVKHFGQFACLNRISKEDLDSVIGPFRTAHDRRKDLRVLSPKQVLRARALHKTGVSYSEITRRLSLPFHRRQTVRQAIVRTDYYSQKELSAA